MKRKDNNEIERSTAQTAPVSDNIGFASYSAYKNSEMYKRYQAARASLPQEALGEAMNVPQEKGKKGVGRGCSIAIIIFGVLFLALAVVGYFVPSTDPIVRSVLGVFQGSNMIQSVLDVISGELSDMFEIIACGALLVADLLAFLAIVGAIVCAAKGKGVGKLMKTGCGLLFLFVFIAMAVILILRNETTIGLAASIILGGVIAVLALAAPKKVKEKK